MPPKCIGGLLMDISGFDLARLTPEFLENPYPTYHALREQDPVRLMPDGSLFLTRHSDLSRVYRDNAVFTNGKVEEFKPKFGDTPLYEHHTTSLVFIDPPLHTRVRRLIAGALTPRAIAGMEAGLVEVVDALLDRMGPRADLIEAYAAAIPIEVIGNLLGVPHGERGPLRDWSLAILGALEPSFAPEAVVRGSRAVTEFLDYLRVLTADRRARPGDPERDVLTRLMQADPAGERLTEVELLHNCIFLLNAGHETTTNLIGNILVLLHEHPGERARLIAEPALVRPAIEEALRYESSNQLGNRGTATDVELGGRTWPAGTRITLCIGAANRDPAVFPDPDRFDVGRTPNRHLSFGAGIHHCAGMSLARLEGVVAVSRLLHRFPHYELAEAPVRGMRARFRGFASVPAVLNG